MVPRPLHRLPLSPIIPQNAVNAAPTTSANGRSIEPERFNRWADLLRDRPATGDSNAMSSWLLEVLAVSDLEKPLAAKGSVDAASAGAEQAAAAMAGIAAGAASEPLDTPKESEKDPSNDKDADPAEDSKKRDRSEKDEDPVEADAPGVNKKAKTDAEDAVEEAPKAPEIVGEAV